MRTSFFDPAWTQAIQATQRADAAMEVAGQQADAFGSAITSLRAQVSRQDAQIRLLQAAMGVLASALRDNGHVDGVALDQRLNAVLATVEKDISTEANTVACASCGRRVAKAQTTVTEHGVVCDRCA